MHGDGSLHTFALCLDVTPPAREAEWGQILRKARPTPGMQVSIRTPTTVLFTIEAEMEFMAIDQAMRWVQSVADAAKPPVGLVMNAQPAHEV